MEIRMDLIDPYAIEATNIRNMQDVKPVIESVRDSGLIYPIHIVKLWPDEAQRAYKRREEEAKKQKKPKTPVMPEYGILDGHTRYAAYKKLKRDIIPVEIIKRQENDAYNEMMYAYKANIARQDMTPEQKGEMIHKMIESGQFTSVELAAKAIGWTKAYGHRLVKKYEIYAGIKKVEEKELSRKKIKWDILCADLNKYINNKNVTTSEQKAAAAQKLNDIAAAIKEAAMQLNKTPGVELVIKQQREKARAEAAKAKEEGREQKKKKENPYVEAATSTLAQGGATPGAFLNDFKKKK